VIGRVSTHGAMAGSATFHPRWSRVLRVAGSRVLPGADFADAGAAPASGRDARDRDGAR
jgi:hypothetical protein